MEPNHIEKNIQNKLKDYENFDGDKMAMWSAIDAGLEEKKKKKRFFFFWLVGLVLVFSLFSLFFWNDNSPSTKVLTNTMTTTSSAAKHSNVQEASTAVNQTNAETANKKTFDKDVVKEDFAQNNETQKRVNQLNSNSKKELEQITKQKNQLTTESVNDLSPNQVQTTTTLFSNKENTARNLENDWNNKSNNNITDKETNPSAQILPLKKSVFLLPTLLIDSISSQLKPLLIDELKIPSSPSISANKSKWSINFSTGINNHISNYKSDTEYAQLRNETERNLAGWQLQLELGYQFNNNISLTSGVQFSRSWVKFEYNKEETTQTILDNTILTYHINTHWFTNDTILQYGEAVVDSETNREVKHHNRFDRIQIPILIGQHVQKGRFALGYDAGIGLDFWMHRSGKALNPDAEIKEFNQTDTNNYNKFGCSLKLRPMFGLAISDRAHIFVQPSFNLSLADWSSSIDGLSHKPFTYGVNLGYRFKL